MTVTFRYSTVLFPVLVCTEAAFSNNHKYVGFHIKMKLKYDICVQPSGAAVAYSVQYFMCFVEPVADALKNETYRAVVQRAQGSVFNDGLVQVLTNLSVAKDLYQLVWQFWVFLKISFDDFFFSPAQVQNVPINSGRTPNVTKSSVTCPAPIIAPMPVVSRNQFPLRIQLKILPYSPALQPN